jgi:adenylosuccinate lyase
LSVFIKGLQGVPEAEKQRLLAMTPATYIGMATDLARKI